MTDRAYTVKEIDELRSLCERKYLYNSFTFLGGMSRSYVAADKITAVEQTVRTYMLAGLTGSDLIASEASGKE